MKTKFLFFVLFFSIKILACKCNGNPNLKSSFENADFVFIGNIYEINEVPSGYKNTKNILSSIKIEKNYKSNHHDGFYQNDATIFGSPQNFCDILFTEKGKYLIFAYYDDDTNFLNSDQCFYTKKLSEISAEELNILDELSIKFNKKSQTERTKKLSNEELENIDILIDTPTPNRKTNTLKKNISNIKTENTILKLLLGITTIIILGIVVYAVIKTVKKKQKSY